MLGNAMMFLLRGVPVVYYGDEQGFVGHGVDQDARQDMFASHVASYNDQTLLGSSGDYRGGETSISSIRSYAQIAGLAKLRQEQPALQHGRQIVRAHGTAPGLFAAIPALVRWPRARRGVQHVECDGGVAESKWKRTSVAFKSLRGACAVKASAPGSFRVEVPAVGLRRLPGVGPVKLKFTLATLALLAAQCAVAQVAQVAHGPSSDATSGRPGALLPFSLRVNGEGRPEYSIARNGQRWSTGRDWASSWRMRPSSSATSRSIASSRSHR
jgi:hypothetical protein